MTAVSVWRKDVAGGIVAPAIVCGENVLFTASDGKLRAWNRKDGETRWVYDARMPVFAGPAASDDTAYVADLKGVVHAVGLDDGKMRWTFDIGTDPATKAPGYGLWHAACSPRPAVRGHLQSGRYRRSAAPPVRSCVSERNSKGGAETDLAR